MTQADDSVPVWQRLAELARDPHGIPVQPASSEVLDRFSSVVLREVSRANAEKRRERWLWGAAWVGLAASLLICLTLDWSSLLPSRDCPLFAAQLVSEEIGP